MDQLHLFTSEENSNKNNGALWIFEGPDGVGKTSLIKKTASIIKRSNSKVLVTSFPGDKKGSLGKVIYKLHHQPDRYGLDSISSVSLQVLHIAAHIDNLIQIIKPAIERGEIVLLDRFWWSTYVYGRTDGISEDILNKIIEIEKTFWGDINVNGILLVKAKKPFIDELSYEKWLNIAGLYEELANNSSLNVIRIENNKGQLRKNTNYISSIIHPVAKTNKIKEKMNIISLNSPPKPSIVYDTYWKFATERQNIFFKRACHERWPWSEDPIFLKHKFTNAYRASDRVSQYLIKNVIYGGCNDYSTEDTFFRIMLFKLFNKIETWEAFIREFGDVKFSDYKFKYYDKVLIDCKNRGERIYSAAYIMPSGSSSFGCKMKHQNNLKLLEKMMDDKVPQLIMEMDSLENVYSLLLSYPSLGNFLAFQYTIDLNYSELINFDEMSFVVAGPGAKDGITKCFSDLCNWSETDIIKYVTESQDKEFSRLGLSFHDLCGRKLQLIDCQNLFCEVDKYSRVAHPEMSGLTGRKKIKQIFQATVGDISYFYPPKWGINDKIKLIQEKGINSC